MNMMDIQSLKDQFNFIIFWSNDILDMFLKIVKCLFPLF